MSRAFGGRHVALVGRRGRLAVAEPLFEPGPVVALDRKTRTGSERLALTEFGPGRARLVRELGRADVARDVVEALIWERLGWVGFRSKIERQAESVAAEIAAAPGPRRDLTELATFTVDPATARDFDDAVSARREGDGVRLWIHIADVAAHVKPGSALDREAERRGNSTYVPGMVEPMLPRALSGEACSLAPGVERLAVTTEVLVGADGRPGQPSFYRSLIRSDARLDYDQLDRIFADREQAPEVAAEPLALTRQVAAALAERRGGSALEVETYEPSYRFDSEGQVEGSRAETGTEAHRLIEQLMVLTNELVAERLEQQGLPTLYRVHERPDPERAAFLVEKLAQLGVPTPPVPDQPDPEQAAAVVAAASRMVAEAIRREGRGRHAFASLILRSLKQARYSEDNSGHAGLGSLAYCHFTSPIRRYPDLEAHRALLSMLGEGEVAPTRRRAHEIALHCSETDRDSIRLERDADDICGAFLLERELFEGGFDSQFEGEVAGLVGGGAFVSFSGELGELYEGFLPVARIGREWFELNQTETAVVGTRSGKQLRLGDPITVTVDRIEPIRGRVTLDQSRRPDRGGARRGRPRPGPG